MSIPPQPPHPQGSHPQGIPYPSAPQYGSQPGQYGSQPGPYGSQPGPYDSQPGPHGAIPQPQYGSAPHGAIPHPQYGSAPQQSAAQPYGSGPHPYPGAPAPQGAAPYPGGPSGHGYVHGQPVPAGPARRPPVQSRPKKPLTKRWWFWALIVLVVFAFLGSLGGGGEDTSAGAPDGQAAEAGSGDEAGFDEGASGADEAAADEAPAEEPAAGIGDPVEAGDFEVTVVSVESGVERVGDEYWNEEASGQFVLVELSVKNLSDTPEYFWEDSLRLTDPEGREYSSDSDGQIAIASETDFLLLEEINPGNTAEGVVVFDVPEGITPDALTVEAGFLSEPVRISLS